MIEWQKGWSAFETEPHRLGYDEELRRELLENPGHKLHGLQLESIGVLNDDIIVRSAESGLFAWAHLTWNRETDPRWPHAEIIGDEAALNRFLNAWDADLTG